MPLAHVVTAGSGPGLIAWLPAGVAMAAILVFGFGPRRFRRVAALLTGAGLATVVLLDVFASSPPSPPGYALTIVPAAGIRVTSPFTVVACGRAADHSSVPVPGGDRVISVSLDGREVFSTTASRVLLTASVGSHRVRVEVLTRDHVEFQPVLAVDAQIVVTGLAPVGPIPSCP